MAQKPIMASHGADKAVRKSLYYVRFGVVLLLLLLLLFGSFLVACCCERSSGYCVCSCPDRMRVEIYRHELDTI